MAEYFSALPTIFYNGQQSKDLLARVKLSNDVKNDVLSFYPYTIIDADGRHDTLSNRYYGSSSYSWLIYLANDTVDPYFDLGLDLREFEQHITKKYGSLAVAQEKIAFYRTNWELIEESTITSEEYEALDPSRKKFYVHVDDIYGSITRYQRKREDVIVSTNRIYQIEIENSTGTFKENERVSVQSSLSNYGYVTFANSSVVTLQHINGAFQASNNSTTYTLLGKETQHTATIRLADEALEFNPVHLVFENIPSGEEAAFWMSVSLYDYESELNSAKRNIQLVDKRYRSKMEEDLKKAFRQ
jgi:hypothetical protein